MKFASFRSSNQTRIGFLYGNYIIDFEMALSSDPGGSIPRDSSYGVPMDMLQLIQEWDKTWPIAVEMQKQIECGEKTLKDQPYAYPINRVKLVAPLYNPSKIVCVGLNYRDYCEALHLNPPRAPLLFSKFPSAIIGPNDPIQWSEKDSVKVDYEAELGFIVKKKCYRISPEEAPDYIAGYTIVNDISARDLQAADVQWTRGKSFDTFCPVGPYLVTPDEIANPNDLAIRCTVNGEVLQDSSTQQMFFNCYDILSYTSQYATLLPGDLFATGTPNGVAISRTPPTFLKNGDHISVEIEGLGCLENTVKVD